MESPPPPPPSLGMDVLIRVFGFVGWLAVPPLRLVCRDWRHAADKAMETRAVVRAVDVACRGRLTKVRVVSAVRLLPALRFLCLSPGRLGARPGSAARARSRGPYVGGRSAEVVKAVLASWRAFNLNNSLRVLQLCDVGTDSRTPSKAVFGPRDLAVVAASGSALRALRVDRCAWWSDTFASALLADSMAGAPVLDELTMSSTAATAVSVQTCWRAGVVKIDARSCQHVEGVLRLWPMWIPPRGPLLGGGEGGGGGSKGLGAPAERGVSRGTTATAGRGGAASRLAGNARAGQSFDATASAGPADCGTSGRDLGAPAPVAELNLCATRLTGLHVVGAPRVAPLLSVNVAGCGALGTVYLSPAPLVSVNFSACRNLAALPVLGVLTTGSAAVLRAGGPARDVRAMRPDSVNDELVFPALKSVSLFQCRSVPVRRLSWTSTSVPALSKLCLSGVVFLAELSLRDLPVLTDIDASGCTNLATVSIASCPALRFVNLQGKKAPLSRVSLQLQAGVNVRGVRSAWSLCWTDTMLHVLHG